MECYIGPKGYTIYKKTFSAEWIRECIRELTVSPVVPRIVSQSYLGTIFTVYQENDKKIYMPLYFGIEKLGKEVPLKLSHGNPISINFSGKLREDQISIVNKYMNAVQNQRFGGGLLDVMTGSGKTVMALNIISQIKKKTLIIVHKSFLLNQWVERIIQFLPGAKVGRIQGEIVDVDDKDIVIGMLQSLSMKTYHTNTFLSFGLLICDECHHLSAEVFVKALQKIVVPYTLGLSATMQRKDGLTKVFKMFLGPVLHKDKKITRCVWIKKISYIDECEEYREVKTDWRGNPLYSSMISKISNHTPRSDFLVKLIIRQMNLDYSHSKKQQLMVLSHTKSLLIYLYKELKNAGMSSIGYYVGGMKDIQLKQSESCDIILATYAMASEGLDIKSLTTLLMSTPKTDVVQAVGRILRTDGHTPVVLDIVDEHDVFRKQWSRRLKYYKKEKYKINYYTNTNYLDEILDKISSDSDSSPTQLSNRCLLLN